MKRKTWCKIAIFAFLLAAVLLCSVKQEAGATIDAGKDVLIDYVNETMTVNTTQDTVIYFTDTYYADLSRWEVCEVRNGKAVFDISWINEGKTVRMYLCGDKQTTVVSKDVAWQEEFNVVYTGTLLSADITEAEQWKKAYKDYENFSIDTGYLIFTVDTNGRNQSYFDLQNIEWRKGDDGVWREFKELDLKEMNIKGISLGFRIKATNDTTTVDGSRTSSVATVKIMELVSAPSTDLNANTMEISVRNGQEVSFDRKTWVLIPDYNKKLGVEQYLFTMAERNAAVTTLLTSERIAGLSLQELLGIKGNDKLDYASLTAKYPNRFTFDDPANPTAIILYVRTAGTERKAASKITEVLIPLADAALVPEKDALTITNTTSASTKAGITIVNNSDDRYQIAVITPEEYALIADKDDIDVTKYYWHSVKGGKILKLTRTKVPQGAYLMYRIAGEEDTLPSTYILHDQPVDYTVVVPTPTPSVAP